MITVICTGIVLVSVVYLVIEVKKVRKEMATQAQVDAVTAKVNKVITEIQALKEREPNLDLSALEAAVQSADDENPDEDTLPETV